MVLDGSLAGRHQSPFHGFSSEFAQYKNYNNGDDIRFLDWRVYGKSDRLVVKQYQDETNTNLYLVLDSSASMGFSGGAALSKLEYASVLAASLAMLAHNQRDAISLSSGAGGPEAFLPPRNGASHLREAYRRLEKLKAAGQTDLNALLRRLAPGLKSSSMTFLFTDLWQEPERILSGLRSVRHRNQWATVVHLLSPEEVQFMRDGEFELEDLETKATLRLTAIQSAARYERLLQQHVRSVRAGCHELGVHFNAVVTDSDFLRAFRQILRREDSSTRTARPGQTR